MRGMNHSSNMQRLDCEVLVVGAGPTGLAAALALTAQGVRVAIVDEAPERHREARASAVHARTLELLAPFGVADRIAAYATPIHLVRFFASDGREIMRRNFHAPIAGMGCPARRFSAPESTANRISLTVIVMMRIETLHS